LQEGKKTLLIVGGSLGARSINEAIANGLKELLAANLQIIWQTGKPHASDWKAKGEQYGVWVNDFINQMEMAYAAADIVISRAGAMAIAELCVVKKPVIFVPFPFAAEDHQTVNAMNLVQKNAALMIRDNEVNERLVQAIIELNRDEQKQEQLKNNISQFAVVDADVKVAEEILNIINN
jgi:UDP-N-acetylglucosamine--N-acetylmuramyl-(pentapeptide) pyrophosphoryl-undecaprenol N-acetylglucosamine transferase